MTWHFVYLDLFIMITIWSIYIIEHCDDRERKSGSQAVQSGRDSFWSEEVKGRTYWASHPGEMCLHTHNLKACRWFTGDRTWMKLYWSQCEWKVLLMELQSFIWREAKWCKTSALTHPAFYICIFITNMGSIPTGLVNIFVYIMYPAHNSVVTINYAFISVGIQSILY